MGKCVQRDNLIVELRTRLKLNQVDFAKLLGKSLQSLRNYEKHPEDVRDEVVDRLKTIAAEHGFGDLATLFSSEDWNVRRVFEPTETLISSKTKPALQPPQRHHKWHSLLDEILDSEDGDAVSAVQSNLVVFGKYVRDKKKKPIPARQRSS
jgi:DNA-binding XRE family transcriptional regulator